LPNSLLQAPGFLLDLLHRSRQHMSPVIQRAAVGRIMNARLYRDDTEGSGISRSINLAADLLSFERENRVLRCMRIPRDADQRSELMSITIPK
jgi:hypothetical protein